MIKNPQTYFIFTLFIFEFMNWNDFTKKNIASNVNIDILIVTKKLTNTMQGWSIIHL